MIEKKLGEKIKKFEFKVFILFGSRATSNFQKNSDWDFAYFREKELSENEKNQLWDILYTLTNNENIDIIHINTTHDPLVKKEIFTKGKLLYGNEEVFSRMQDQAVFEYLDFEPNYIDQKEIISKRLELL